jgi:hypothetical protein
LLTASKDDRPAERRVGSASIVELDEDGKSGLAFLVRRVRLIVCPLVEEGLDEPLGLAVGLRATRGAPDRCGMCDNVAGLTTRRSAISSFVRPVV